MDLGKEGEFLQKVVDSLLLPPSLLPYVALLLLFRTRVIPLGILEVPSIESEPTTFW